MTEKDRNGSTLCEINMTKNKTFPLDLRKVLDIAVFIHIFSRQYLGVYA